MRLAILADIHGNLPALEAVLVELERLQPDAVVLDGDMINGVPFSCQVIDLVRTRNWTVVRGNHEFYFLDFGTPRALPGADNGDRWGQLHWLVEQITPAQGAYLALLPDDITVYAPGAQPLRVAHGVPGRNRVGFYRSQGDAAIVAEIETVPERTLVSAHTHVQIDRHVRRGGDGQAALFADPHGATEIHGRLPAVAHQWHVVNPGSVGLPLDGRPVAQFALLESVADSIEPGGWRATHLTVEYDRRPALEAFHTSGMLEAGGVMSTLFYWEVVTARTEIIAFFRWAQSNGLDPDRDDMQDCFARYTAATGRDEHVRSLDPRYGGAAR